VPPAEVRTQLDKVLSSENFVKSVRLSRFLRLAVERTLAGRQDSLKESTLGRDVFDRRADYDPRTDSIVRVEARRLRRKLKEYYDHRGRHDPVSIIFQPGGYVPAFQWRSASDLPGATTAIPTKLDPNTVAVLPFVNLSADPEQMLFCDGTTGGSDSQTDFRHNARRAWPDYRVCPATIGGRSLGNVP
jgi:serine/threonine-protein kinase